MVRRVADQRQRQGGRRAGRSHAAAGRIGVERAAVGHREGGAVAGVVDFGQVVQRIAGDAAAGERQGVGARRGPLFKARSAWRGDNHGGAGLWGSGSTVWWPALSRLEGQVSLAGGEQSGSGSCRQARATSGGTEGAAVAAS